jgi:hypothetical protein
MEKGAASDILIHSRKKESSLSFNQNPGATLQKTLPLQT